MIEVVCKSHKYWTESRITFNKYLAETIEMELNATDLRVWYDDYRDEGVVDFKIGNISWRIRTYKVFSVGLMHAPESERVTVGTESGALRYIRQEMRKKFYILLRHKPETAMERLRENPGAAGYCDEDGNSPLHVAACAGHLDLVRCLIEIWPDGVRTRNRMGYLPLHDAAVTDNVQVAIVLARAWPEGLMVQTYEAEETPSDKADYNDTPLLRIILDGLAAEL